MAISDRLNKLTTDITNAYTSIENKGGIIPANKNTNNLHTAIDSIEVIEQATAEGESLNLTNTKAMPYSDYVVEGKSEQEGEPSPSNPSEIHSVADDVNLLNLQDIENHSVNSYYENIGTNFQLKAGETYTLSFDAESDITPFDVGIGCGSNGYYESDMLNKHGLQNGRISITFTPQNSNFTYGNYLAVRFVRYNASTSYTYSAKNIKLQKGTVVTPYSPYNQGTVTIKQRGKNLFNNNDTVATEYASIIKENNGFEYTRTGQTLSDIFIATNTQLLKPNTVYSFYYKRSRPLAVFFYADNLWGTQLSRETLKATSEYQIYKFTTNETGKVVIGFYSSSQTMGDKGSFSDIMILEGIFNIAEDIGNYEPYQGYDKVLQTEPLRSLPNGVKDTIEAEQHRKIGRRLLQASDIYDIVTTGTIPYVRIAKNTLGMVSGTFANNTARMKSYKITGNVNYSNTNNREFNTYWDRYYLAIFDNRFTDLATAKQLLEGEEIIYELAEEIIEPLTQNQATTMLDIIKTGSYEGTTNIYTDEDVKPTMKAGYYKKG